MQNQMDRTLTILADGEPVTGYARARLLGTERLGLYPSLFMLHLWNVAEEDYLLLSRCKEVTVLHKDVVLVSGTVSDAFRHLIRPSGTCLGYRPFSAENEHTGSFSGRDEPRDDTESSRNDPFGQHVFDNVEEITDKEEKMPENRYVTGPNNETVNLRKKPDGALIDRIRSGETAKILTEGPVWSKVRIGSRVGWMMTRFLAEELTSINNEELIMNNDTEEELLNLLTEVYEGLRELCDRIENVIAKG